MYTLTAADFADTGQWRLLLNIWSTGLEAFIENTIHPEIEPQKLCDARWELNRDRLRQNIEDAVYANPRLLDDFSTRVTLYEPRTLFIPSEVAESYTGAEEDIYNKVYKADRTDIMTDYDGDITAAWAMAPGVKSFLMRTFPGAKITCNLMNKVRNLRKSNDDIRIFVFTKDNEADIIMLDKKNLISASTHEWHHTDDIAYLILNLIEVYEYNLKDIGIDLQGVKTDTDAWNYIQGKAKIFVNR